MMPSRARSKMLYDNFKRFSSLAKDPDSIELVLYIDQDDEDTIQMYEVMKRDFPNVVAMIGERPWPHGVVFNKLYSMAEGDILAYMSDDIKVDTEGWDKMVIDEFDKIKDKILLVYGDDGFNESKMGSVGFVHKNWIEAIGHLFPDGFMARGGDSWVSDVAKRSGRAKYLKDLKLSHLKYETRERDVRDGAWEKNRQIRKQAFREYRSKEMESLRKDEAEKLKQFIKNYEG